MTELEMTYSQPPVMARQPVAPVRGPMIAPQPIIEQVIPA